MQAPPRAGTRRCADSHDRDSDEAATGVIGRRRSPPDGLRAWVFRQDTVWLDAAGKQRRIDRMASGEVEEVIAFCRQRAAEITTLLALDLHAESLELRWLHGDHRESQCRAMDAFSLVLVDPLEFIGRTPLMRALRRRLTNGAMP
jgi:hypothetical protein